MVNNIQFNSLSWERRGEQMTPPLLTESMNNLKFITILTQVKHGEWESLLGNFSPLIKCHLSSLWWKYKVVITRGLWKDMEKHNNKLIQPFLPLKTSVMPLVEVIIIFVIVTGWKDSCGAQANQTVYGRLSTAEGHKETFGTSCVHTKCNYWGNHPYSRLKKLGQFKSFLEKRVAALGELLGGSPQAKRGLSLWDDGPRMGKHSEHFSISLKRSLSSYLLKNSE